MTKHAQATEPAGEVEVGSKDRSRQSVTRRMIRLRQHTRPLARRFVKRIANSSLPAIFFVSSFLLARYLPNSDFSYPSEILLPITLFALLATVAFYAYRWTFKGKSGPAHVATFFFIYAVYGFAYAFPYVQKITDTILPSSLTTSFSSAITRMLLLAIGFWLLAYATDQAVRRVKPLRHFQPYKVMLFAVCFIFAVQGAKVVDRLWDIRHQLAYNHSSVLPVKPAGIASSADKPNVYYLVFDRYASLDTLNQVYNFDNSDLMNYFADQGFVARSEAYANYPFTQQSLSSTLSMGYLSDFEKRFKTDAGKFQTAFPYRTVLRHPPVAEVFRQNGYQYNQVSSWWDFTRVGVEADSDPVKSFRLRILGLEFWLTDLQRDIFYRSAFSQILQKGITVGNITIAKYDQDRNPRQNFHDQMTAIQGIARNSQTQTQPQFTFAHILSPHDPYIFAADGTDAPYNGDRTDQDLDEYKKYTNQLTYVNQRIKELISTLRSQDPTAVIIFQPDEGPYPKQFRGKLTERSYFDPKNLDDTSMRHKFGITAAYYMPGVDQYTTRQELTNSVDAFPFVLNHYLGYDVAYLPECNFSAGNKFVIYDYTLTTGRLYGTSTPASCQQFDR